MEYLKVLSNDVTDVTKNGEYSKYVILSHFGFSQLSIYFS